MKVYTLYPVMEELLSFLAKGMTGSSDIKIESEENNDFINFKIVTPKEFVGLLVGKGGRTIKALRNLLKVRATLEKRAVGLTVEEA